jgi:hypothetical protein
MNIKLKLIILLYCLISSESIFSQEVINEASNSSIQPSTYFGQIAPGETPKIFAPEVILKPKQAHSNIVFSKDGNSAYWCHNGIWYSKLKNGEWTSPLMVPFSKMEFNDDAPFLSPDGKQLFFTSKRPINDSDTSKKENIWVVDLEINGWSEASPLPPVVNNVFQHWQVSVDLKGNLYLKHRAKQNVDSSSDIYCSKFENGEYQTPKKLGGTINSLDQESNPFISPDGDLLLFTRIKDGNLVDGGLFISLKLKNNTWSESISLQPYLNYKSGGNCPIVTQDGKHLFFLDIYEGKWQRYWVSAGFVEMLRPEY